MKKRTSYICSNCGAVFSKWMGKCSECESWDTITEEVAEASSKNSLNGLSVGSGFNKTNYSKYSPTETPINIRSVNNKTYERVKTGISEFDIVLGGGITVGSATLIGGEPGIGKSTIMLAISGIMGKLGKRVLYISGEESPYQIKMRAERMGVTSENIDLLSTNKLEDAMYALATGGDYELVILDSIQTVSSIELASASGTVSQVRHCASELINFIKSRNSSIFIVGQITKEGSIAGPKVLEHLVDAVLYFEGDHSRGLRILRSIKNRFGPAHEVAIFEMSESGLVESTSNLIATSNSKIPGKSLCCVYEGSRVFLVEVQALVSPTFFQYPKRNSTGFDNNRIQMLLAVLEKKAGINLSSLDVYVNVAGGFKLTEAAADLAICQTIISAYRESQASYNSLFLGEVSLTGEIKSVPNIEMRIKEAQKHGITEFIIPKSYQLNSAKKEKSVTYKGINIHEVEFLSQILDYI